MDDCGRMEGIILNIKSTSGGSATATLVQQALRARKVFVFGELLDLPQVQSLRNSPETAPTLAALEIFAYGTFADYVSRAGSLPELNEAAAFKLRQLTVMSLASKTKNLSYDSIMKETHLSTIRDAEDLVIACVYDGLLKARLDQKGRMCVVQWCAARDVLPTQVSEMNHKLEKWCEAADDILNQIDRSLAIAASEREKEQKDHIR